MTGFKGGCLCEAMRYENTADAAITGHCNCIDCRKTSGTGHGSHMRVSEDALAVTGDLTFYDAPADTGNTVSRGFCPTCGSAIYSTNTFMPDMVFMRASSLDD